MQNEGCTKKTTRCHGNRAVILKFCSVFSLVERECTNIQTQYGVIIRNISHGCRLCFSAAETDCVSHTHSYTAGERDSSISTAGDSRRAHGSTCRRIQRETAVAGYQTFNTSWVSTEFSFKSCRVTARARPSSPRFRNTNGFSKIKRALGSLGGSSDFVTPKIRAAHLPEKWELMTSLVHWYIHRSSGWGKMTSSFFEWKITDFYFTTLTGKCAFLLQDMKPDSFSYETSGCWFCICINPFQCFRLFLCCRKSRLRFDTLMWSCFCLCCSTSSWLQISQTLPSARA